MNNKISPIYDLIIIGGGPAGMSAALMAGRCRFKTLVINAESPRNAVTTAAHGFVTRDGIHPLQFMEIAKEQLKKYDTVTYIRDFVLNAEQSGQGFRIATSQGQPYAAKNIVFATGYVDQISKSKLPGIEKVYGKSVFPCPFCDGWEHREQRLALFDGTEHASEFAKVIANWSRDLIIFTNGKQNISEEQKRLLQRGGVDIIEAPVAELVANSEGHLQFVALADGRRIKRDAGFLGDAHEKPATLLPEKLGVRLKKGAWGMPALDVNEFGQTNISGIYIVGDASTGFGGLARAAYEGANCIEMMLHEKVKTHWSSLET